MAYSGQHNGVDRVWAMTPAALGRLVVGAREVATDWKAALVAAERRAEAAKMTTSGAVAVIPIVGAITHRASLWSEFFGDTSVQRLAMRVRDAMSDPNVKTVLLDMDSPGGTIDGVPEFADELFGYRGVKPISAISNTEMNSAAYWLGSQVDEVIASPSAIAGSIGVWTMHQDLSGLLEQAGVKITLVSAGKYKVEGNPFEPLSDEARDRLQELADAAYTQFLKAVARGRGVSVADVRKTYGEGRSLLASEAKAAGMIDRVATLDQTLTRLVGRPKAASLSRAESAMSDTCIRADRAEMVEPDEDGNCPDGYEKGDDGMCHMMRDGEDDAKAAADRDAIAITIALSD